MSEASEEVGNDDSENDRCSGPSVKYVHVETGGGVFTNCGHGKGLS